MAAEVWGARQFSLFAASRKDAMDVFVRGGSQGVILKGSRGAAGKAAGLEGGSAAGKQDGAEILFWVHTVTDVRMLPFTQCEVEAAAASEFCSTDDAHWHYADGGAPLSHCRWLQGYPNAYHTMLVTLTRLNGTFGVR